MAIVEIDIPDIILENHQNLDEIKQELFESLVHDVGDTFTVLFGHAVDLVVDLGVESTD